MWDIHGNSVEETMSFTLDTSSISDTEWNELQEERRAMNLSVFPNDGGLTEREKEVALENLKEERTMLPYLFKLDRLKRQLVYDILPPDARERVKFLFGRYAIDLKSRRPRNMVEKNKKLWTYEEVKKILEEKGLPTKRLYKACIGEERRSQRWNKYLNAYPADLLDRRNDSQETRAWKDMMRKDVTKRGLLQDTLNVDLKQLHKEKLMKQLGAVESDFKLRLKERKLFWRKQRAALRRGQRGTADRSVPNLRPKHLNTGKMKPWKKTRGRGYSRK
mmetsp:Transcript_18002/g.25073  ORF Transcript_18002/g.25073 Transcript_18002/m.25073 type:complete len:276 (-) Transcript_18002:4-831(-)